MRLFIHIGFHKTGTSAIQAFSKKNRKNLAKQGILYPKTGTSKIKFPSTPSSEGGHRSLSDAFVSLSNAKSIKKLKSILEEARDYHNIDTVVLSSEVFSAPRVKLSTSAMVELKKYFSDVKILVYLRRQDDWAETFYKEVLCWSGRREKREFEEFHAGFLQEWLDYGNRLKRWADVFGKENLIVKSYDDRENKNIIIDFYSTLGIANIDDKIFDFSRDINPSLPNNLVPLLMKINKYYFIRKDKSYITNLIFHKLEKSERKVEKIGILSNTMLSKYRAKFGPKNAMVCKEYHVANNDCLTFRKNKDKNSQLSEVALSKETVTEIQDLAKSLNKGSLENFLYKGQEKRENEGRVGISCLINERELQTKVFVYYHLELGVQRIRLYFDNPDDTMADYYFGTDRVEVIRCTPEFWKKHLGRVPENNGEKLTVCHEDGLNYLVKHDDIDWAVNLDGDELLYVSPHTTLNSYLSKMKFPLQIRSRPLEAIFVTENDAELFSARYFKVPRLRNKMKNERPGGNRILQRIYRKIFIFLDSKKRYEWCRKFLLRMSNFICVFLPWSKSDERLYQKYMPVLSTVIREGFLAHREGRVFTRHGLELYEVKSHRPKFVGWPHKIRKQNNTIFVLHYDAVDYAGWHLKWHRRVYGDTNATAIADKRRIQMDMFKAAFENGEHELKNLFNELFMFPEQSIPKFQKAGLVVKLDLSLIKEVKDKYGI